MVIEFHCLCCVFSGKGVYYLDFTVPDVYGVYKFVINYVKKGYSALSVSHQVRFLLDGVFVCCERLAFVLCCPFVVGLSLSKGAWLTLC